MLSSEPLIKDRDHNLNFYETIHWNERKYSEEIREYNKHKQEITARKHSLSYAKKKKNPTPTFVANNTCSLCCCLSSIFCCFNRNSVEIENSDILIYTEYKKTTTDILDFGNKAHYNSLRFLYVQTLNSDLNKDLINDKWKLIGFSSSDPKDDFKIGGYYSLLFINYFVSFYESEFSDITKKINNSFGMIANILCFFFRLALDLFFSKGYADFLRKVNDILPVNNRQFVNFCNKYNSNHDYPFMVMAQILISYYQQINDYVDPSVEIKIKEIKNAFKFNFYNELNESFNDNFI